MSDVRSQDGPSPLLMLVALVSMMCVMAYSVRNIEDLGGKVETIAQAGTSACSMQREQVMQDILLYWVDHPTDAATRENLANAGYSVEACPDGGEYEVFGRKVLCSLHSGQEDYEAAERAVADAERRRAML